MDERADAAQGPLGLGELWDRLPGVWHAVEEFGPAVDTRLACPLSGETCVVEEDLIVLACISRGGSPV